MSLFGRMELTDSIEIEAAPEKLWEFFLHLEENYRAWHPQDHIVFKWTAGRPMASGSRWYAEETLRGKVFRLKGTIGEVVPGRRIVFKNSFPVSLAAPGFEWRIEPKGSGSVFTAISHLRAGRLLVRFFRKEMETKLAMHREHVKAEGENLKRLMESTGEDGSRNSGSGR